MSELDVELKQTIGGLRWILEITEQRGLPKVSVEVDELRSIIAALEDRERLRAANDDLRLLLRAALEDRDRLWAAARELFSYHESLIARPEFDELRAALEGRDG